MKRIFSLLLVTVLLFACALPICRVQAENGQTPEASAATDIVLPNGLKFGMSMDEAAAVSGYRRVTGYIEELSKYGLSEKDYLRTDDLTIGGHKAVGYFYFDGGKLVQAHYRLADAKAEDIKTIDPSIASSYSEVMNALDGKYGSFRQEDAGHRFRHLLPMNYTITLSSTVLEFLVGGSDYKSSYVIPQTDGGSVYLENYVAAQMLVVKEKGLISELSFSDYHYLDYTYYAFQLDPNQTNTGDVDF